MGNQQKQRQILRDSLRNASDGAFSKVRIKVYQYRERNFIKHKISNNWYLGTRIQKIKTMNLISFKILELRTFPIACDSSTKKDVKL